jgi:hypothetical protein
MIDPRTLLVGVLGAATAGCGTDVESCDIDTKSMIMWATITDLGEGVDIEVSFELPGEAGTPLALCPERDRLEINGVETSQVRALGHLYYTAKFSTAAETYEIVLVRDGAPNVSATVEMPPGFEILEPAADSSHPRGAALEVSWAPERSSNMIELAIEDAIGSDCIEGFGVAYEVADIGSYSVEGNSLVAGAEGGSCEVTLALTRSVVADYPTQFHTGGSISAFVRRDRPFISVD